jgi:hypothetical protein
MREPARGTGQALSEAAKFRLKEVFDWYWNSSPRFSLSGTAGREARLPLLRRPPLLLLPLEKAV